MSDSEDDSYEKQLKVVVLGEQTVGKTSLIKRFCYDEFSRQYNQTIGAEFYIRRVNLTGKNEVTVRITDVSGTEINGHMLETYLFNVNMVILAYDITNCASFDSLTIWINVLDRIMKSDEESRSIVVAVLGNKCDLEHKRSVRLDKTNHFIHENKLANYFVSAKTGENVRIKIFNCVNSSFMELIARYFNVSLTRIEKEKQRSIVKAELVPNSPPAIQNVKIAAIQKKIISKNKKITASNSKNNKDNSALCGIQ